MRPRSEKELQDFIDRFEAGALPKEDWHHPEHVAMAFWYLSRMDEEAAIAKMRHGIQQLNSKHDVAQTPTGGYHETWTVFFAKILKRFIENDLDRSLPVIEQMNSAIQHLSAFREITRKYYSRDLIMSWEARTSWKEPDLESL